MSAAPMPLLSIGAFGEAVRLLQKALNKAPTAQARLAEDAAFGPKTRGRVMEFQSKSYITSDGVVGPMTWEKLQPWLQLVTAIVDNPQASAGEAAARERIRQSAEAYLALYGWGGLLPKDPKTKGVDRAALLANPLKIAAAHCMDPANPLRPRAGGASLAIIFQGAGGTAPGKAMLCPRIPANIEPVYQQPAGKAKTDTLNSQDLGSWCGIFATFVWRWSGLKLAGWPLRTRKKNATGDATGFDVQQIDVTDDVQVGDIGVYDYTVSNHHFLVVGVDGNTVHTIDGNIGDPDPGVVAPWSSVVARRSYTRVNAVTLKTMTGKSSPASYFVRPIWSNVL